MEVIQVKDRFFILASSSLADKETRVLKHGETFGLFDRHGDIRPLGFEDHGIYHEGTRFLSRLVLRVEGKNPLLLSSAVKEENDFLLVHLSNQDFTAADGRSVRQGTLHLRRSVFVFNGSCHVRLQFTNFGLAPLSFSFGLQFDADWRDIFEIRGTRRLKRGSRLESVFGEKEVVLRYLGLDNLERRTRIVFSDAPVTLRQNDATFLAFLLPQGETTITMTVACDIAEKREVVDFSSAVQRLQSEDHELQSHETAIVTSNEGFNTWLRRSRSDLTMLLTRTDQGLYPFAGIPWYSTVFGRDGIITALESLWFNPDIARGVLAYLAARQADHVSKEQDAEPGKILHEERKGEMANLKEIPFGEYYGTIDATPLFVILAGHYLERTGDLAFIESLWPVIERALAWIDVYGDADHDGFLEYVHSSDRGLVNQGWKDSEDSVFHADGTLAAAPIALCEVQGYAFEAKMMASRIAALRGNRMLGAKLKREAESLQRKFVKAFWCDELGMYALALDRNKKPCRVRSSNAGQCLFGGIAPKEHAARLAKVLMGNDFFSGWGIRTIGSHEARYNPMSYHNGSVWPHDNALIASGLARYGFKDEAVRILTGLFDASGFMELRRLPELFCGFDRFPGEGPTLYPVACNPQAWASGSAFLLLKSCIGLSIRATENKVYFNNPRLPPFIREMSIANLRVGKSSAEIVLIRHDTDVGVNVRQKEGDVEVIVAK